jgi:hypothetical protein
MQKEIDMFNFGFGSGSSDRTRLMVLLAVVLTAGVNRSNRRRWIRPSSRRPRPGRRSRWFRRQERDHDDDGGAAAGGRADERGDHDDGDAARGWDAGSSAFGTDGFRSAASSSTGQRDHSGGDDADHPDRSAHQRKNQPRGDTFTGEMVDPVLNPTDNSVVVPKGAPVGGVVDVSHRRGHFKGRSLLELRLTSLTLNGTQYPLTTRRPGGEQEGQGQTFGGLDWRRTGLGMLVGGVATGGVGLVVGGLVGGGAGTAAAGLTGNRDLDIPAESIVHFKLADDLVVQIQLIRRFESVAVFVVFGGAEHDHAAVEGELGVADGSVGIPRRRRGGEADDTGRAIRWRRVRCGSAGRG